MKEAVRKVIDTIIQEDFHRALQNFLNLLVIVLWLANIFGVMAEFELVYLYGFLSTNEAK